MTCAHHWTVTSECPMCLRIELDRAREMVFAWRGLALCSPRPTGAVVPPVARPGSLSSRVRPGSEAEPWVCEEIGRLEAELMDAYAEIRKQVFGSRVVFDRALVERAEASGEDAPAASPFSDPAPPGAPTMEISGCHFGPADTIFDVAAREYDRVKRDKERYERVLRSIRDGAASAATVAAVALAGGE